MANPKINIASLDFDSIKTSLKTYLSTKSEFSGYDFNGTAFNSLLDVFAYNTLYYAFYSNFIANEAFLDTASIENNIISLLKPLGYVVPGRAASRASLNVSPVSSTATILPYVDAFTGQDSSGKVYRFYSLQTLNITTATDITVYEAQLVANNITLNVDITNQRAFLGNANIDTNTISVKVNGESWTNSEDFTDTPTSTTKIFFIDRTTDGFYVVFGKQNLNDYETSYGKQIEENDIVTVSYLVPSGIVANGISGIKNAKVIINSSNPSSNGTDSVDLSLVKFFAPKLFSANNRVVTETDYSGLLLSSGLLPTGITGIDQINIWSGDDAIPPVYGRLFVSFADDTITATNTSVVDCVSLLGEKSMVTILPEYVQAQTVDVYMTLVLSGSPSGTSSNIASTIQSYYNTIKKFNNDINLIDIKTVINSNYSGVRNVNLSELYLAFSIAGSDGQKTISFKNELIRGITSDLGSSIISSTFNYTPVGGSPVSIKLADKPRTYDDGGVALTGTLVAINSSTLTELTAYGNLGTVDYVNGYVLIYDSVVPIGTTITLNGYPRYSDAVNITNELLVNTIVTVQ